MDTAEPPPIVIERPAATPQPDAAPPTVHPDAAPSAQEGEARTVELGVGTFLLAGVASSGVVGLTPYLIDGVGQDVFLRLGIGLGESTGSITHMTWAAGRLDTCLAMPGNYAAGSGLQFDLCGGADVGFTVIALDTQPLSLPQRGQTLPYVNLGPSADLRAEFGANAAFSLRGVLGINIARDPYFDGSGSRVDPPLGAARVELGFSWKLQ